MATTKPRVNVTLEPHRYELLKRLAGLQGVSMSYLISDLLETVSEPLERVCVVLEAAAKAPQSVKDGLRAAASKAEGVLLPQAQAWMDQSDLFFSDVLKAAEGSGTDDETGAAGHGGGAAPDPRPVTRGSTPLRKGTKKPGSKSRKSPSLKGSGEDDHAF